MNRTLELARRGRAALVALVVAVGLVVSSSPALGHAFLVRTDPADGSQLTEGPRLVRLWFSEPLALGLTAVELLDGSGRSIPLGPQPLVTQRSATFTVVLPDLTPDVYRLSWRVRSDGDLHVTTGSIVFGVQHVVGPSVTPAEQPSSSGALEAAAQWAGFVAFAVLNGSLLLAAFAVPYSGARMRRRLLRFALVAASIGGTIVAALDLRVRAAPSEWGDVLGSTAYGASWAAREVLFATAVVALLVLLRGRDVRGAILVTPLLVAIALVESAQSHAAVSSSFVPLLVGALHLLAAGLWAGGVIVLALAVILDLRHDTEARTIAMGTLTGFGPLAAGGVLVLVVSGFYLGGQFVPSLDALVSGTYGHFLLGKVGLAAALGALGLANAAALHGKVRAVLSGIRRPAADVIGAPRVGRSVRFEAVAAGGLLFLAALLSTTDPRAGLAPAPTAPTESRFATVVDGLFVSSVVRPVRPGPNFIDLAVTDTRRPTIAPIDAVLVRLVPDGDPSRTIAETAALVVTDRSGSRYQAAVTLPDATRWQLRIVMTRMGFPDATAETQIKMGTVAPATDLFDQPLEPILNAMAIALAASALIIGAIFLALKARRPRRRTLALGITMALLLTSFVPGGRAVAAVPSGVSAAGGGSVAAPAAASNEPIDVIVVLRDQFDHSAAEGHDRGERERIESEGLQATAARSQPFILDLLNRVAAAGDVERLEPLWITNAIAMRARPAVIRALAASPLVARIDPDLVISAPAGGAAGLSAAAIAETNIALVKADAVWNLGYQGQGIVVASLDTGVDYTHPDLAAQWRGGTNSWFDPYTPNPHPFPTDLAGTSTGHGTMTMGVIVGRDASGTSIGMAPQAKWIAAKIFDDSGNAPLSKIHEAFQWVLTSGATIVNNSWTISGVPGCDMYFETDLKALVAAGITPVFAAGNSGPNASTGESPANNPSAFAVGATDNLGAVATFSSRGPDTCGGANVTFPAVVAPGVNIKTTDTGTPPGQPGLYASASGTSLAAPHVTGALALLQSRFPTLTDAQRRAALLCSTVVGAAGPDPVYGNGRIDVLAAYNALLGTLPRVCAVSPNNGSTAGGTTITITGLNFAATPTVSVDGVALAPAAVTFVNAATITAIVPAHAAAAVHVTVTIGANTSATSAADLFTYAVLPTVSAVSPISGTIAGGTPITITGTNFAAGATVSIGGSAASSVTVVTPTSITATTPAHSAGAANVIVTLGSQSTAPGVTFTYNASPPTVTAVTPASGLTTGGTALVITGTNFAIGATVKVDGITVTSSVVSATSINTTTPVHAAGPVDITVTVGGNTSALSSFDTFTYVLPPPTVTAVNPTNGSTAGGTATVITGTNFAGGTLVNVDGVALPSASVTFVNATTINATTPSHAAGTANVTVTVSGQTSATAAVFTYVAPPTVTNVTPNVGPISGGTGITITGTNLAFGAAVSVGGTPAVGIAYVDTSKITATTPAHAAGIFNVTVTVSGLTTAASVANEFTFTAPTPTPTPTPMPMPAPTVSGVSPNNGPTAGGTIISVTGANFAIGATVTVGGTTATVSAVTATTITATTPVHVAGPFDVIVTVGTQASVANAADIFTFVAPPPPTPSPMPTPTPTPAPAVSGVSPNNGPTAGGTVITVTGASFATGATVTVTVGGTAATLSSVTATTITATTPAHAAGPFDVIVTVGTQASVASAAGIFTFVAPATPAPTPIPTPAPAPMPTPTAPIGGGGGGGGGAPAPAPAPVAAAPSQAPTTLLSLRSKPAALQPAPFEIPGPDAYHAEWVAQSAYPTAAPGQLVEWVVAFRNAGSVGWYRGMLGANAALGTSDPLNNELAEQAGMDPGNWQYPSRITVQTTEYVGQGQVAWFVIQLRAPSVMGSYRVHIRPVIDGVTWMEDYGVYFDLTVVAR